MGRRRIPRWLPTVQLEGSERLAALLLIGTTVGLYQCWSSHRHPAAAPASAESAPSVDSSPPAPEAVAASAPTPPPPGGPEQIAEFCDLQHGAAAQLSPTSLSPKAEARTNPFNGKPASYRPRKLTRAQRDAVHRLVDRVPRGNLREDCYALDLGEGARLVMVGLDTACERGCRFHARQLSPRVAKFVMDVATAAAMTIDIEDHVFIPAGVLSDHAGESYATTVGTPAELAEVVLSQYVAGATQYSGPVQFPR